MSYKAEDYKTAAEGFERSADQFPLAAYCLGVMYSEGQGVDQSDEAAAGWFRRAAEKDYPAAQFQLAYCYSEGKGVPQSVQEKVIWLKKAADNGHTSAQTCYAMMLRDGEEGVQQSCRDADYYFLLAAEKGDPQAQYAIACLRYDDKLYGTAIVWLIAAASQEHPLAEYLLGYCYYCGVGVAKCPKTALSWLTKAQEHGDEEAEKLILTIIQEGVEQIQLENSKPLYKFDFLCY